MLTAQNYANICFANVFKDAFFPILSKSILSTVKSIFTKLNKLSVQKYVYIKFLYH